MGRTEPSQGLAPPSFRRDARAKKAKATLNKVIPPLLSAHPRAKRGIEASELIVDPPASRLETTLKGPGGKRMQALPLDTTPRLVLQVADTLAAAHLLLADPATGRPDQGNKDARVAILNMASPLSPGGGFVNGASSQEESLCMRTTLLPSLRDEYYRLPEIGGIYTPDVLVFRDEQNEDLEKKDRWFVDCVSAAMLRMPETEVNEATGRANYTNETDKGLVLQKMRAVMRTFEAKGAKRIVLGAWGCGAYGNPVGEVAMAWRKVFRGGKGKAKARKETWDGIEEVVFAIKDPGLADAFETAFGPGLIRRQPSNRPEKERDDDGDVELMRMKELTDKIKELELQANQARSLQLKTGLQSVLLGLRAQLGEDNVSTELYDEVSPSSSDEDDSALETSLEEDASSMLESETHGEN